MADELGAPITFADLVARSTIPAEDCAPVTQRDRESACRLGRDWLRWTDKQVAATLAGDGDAYPIVQALARHRLDACDSGSHAEH